VTRHYIFWEQASRPRYFKCIFLRKIHSHFDNCYLFFIIFLNFYAKNSEGFQSPEAAGKYEEWPEQRDATSILQCKVTFLYIGHKITHQVSSNMQVCGAIVKHHPNDSLGDQYISYKSQYRQWGHIL
jgi:hypothetical protein